MIQFNAAIRFSLIFVGIGFLAVGCKERTFNGESSEGDEADGGEVQGAKGAKAPKYHVIYSVETEETPEGYETGTCTYTESGLSGPIAKITATARKNVTDQSIQLTGACAKKQIYDQNNLAVYTHPLPVRMHFTRFTIKEGTDDIKGFVRIICGFRSSAGVTKCP